MAGCAKSTIQHAIDSVSDLMEAEADSIRDRMVAKTTPVHIDGIGYPVQGKGCWIWGATDDDATAVVVSGSRGEAVLHEHFPFFERPLTADGYRPYRNAFGTLRRCWAHILR